MTRKNIPAQHHQTFDRLRHAADGEREHWLAREKESCRVSGHTISDHFEDFLDMVAIGSGAQRELPDVRLSRYACYLVVQNGDPSTPVVANGQTYFALQTRRHELADSAAFAELDEDAKRLAIRNELAEHNKQLAAAAKDVDRGTGHP